MFKILGHLLYLCYMFQNVFLLFFFYVFNIVVMVMWEVIAFHEEMHIKSFSVNFYYCAWPFSKQV